MSGTVNLGVMLDLNDLTVAHGSSASGGGVANSGTLTVTNSTFSGNSASDSGGAIENSGTLTVTNNMMLTFVDANLGALKGNVDTSGVSAPFSVISGKGNYKISKFRSRSVKIKFAPTTSGPAPTSTITTNDPDNTSRTVTLMGSSGEQ